VVSQLLRSATALALSSLLERVPLSTSKLSSQGPPNSILIIRSPDTPDAFEKYPYFKAATFSAPSPPGYAPAFVNLNASTSTSAYMGYTTLSKYDTKQCASLCNKQTGCVAFNLYFERDPTLDPNEQTCPNPPSLTDIKCVFWGVPISSATATNQGHYRDEFEVVIAGMLSHFFCWLKWNGMGAD
jgi:hypothetical protein